MCRCDRPFHGRCDPSAACQCDGDTCRCESVLCPCDRPDVCHVCTKRTALWTYRGKGSKDSGTVVLLTPAAVTKSRLDRQAIRGGEAMGVSTGHEEWGTGCRANSDSADVRIGHRVTVGCTDERTKSHRQSLERCTDNRRAIAPTVDSAIAPISITIALTRFVIAPTASERSSDWRDGIRKR